MRHIDPLDANRGLFGKGQLWARTQDKQAVLSADVYERLAWRASVAAVAAVLSLRSCRLTNGS
jgi:hypothetical protein